MNISQWVSHWARHAPRRRAIHFEGVDLEWAEFERLVRKTVVVLRQRFGLRRGERIAWLGHNHPAVLALGFACARAGGVLVPLNTRLAPPEHAFMLRDCGARLLFVDGEFAEAGAALAAGLPGLEVVGVEPSARPAVAALLDESAPVPLDDGTDPAVTLADPLFIYYTSGTTGTPKGAVLTQANVYWHALASVAMHGLHARDEVLTLLPLFHVGGMNVQTTPALMSGAGVTLLRRFTAEGFYDALADRRPTLVVIVPAQLGALTAHPRWPGADLSSLRCVTTGSTIVPSSFFDTFHARGVPVVQVYGCTESCPTAIHNTIDDARHTAGSAGRPALHTEARIVDDAGHDVAVGERGEILLRGPQVIDGYWNDVEATRQAFVDGWLRTGDIGYRDAAGNHFIVDRKKDLIISGSENIYPAEIEAVVAGHPDVAEAAVVGLPDAHWGEVPVIAVVRRPGSALDAETILSRFEGRLGRYKHPREVVFVEALPRNALGKVVKPQLRAEVLALLQGAPAGAGCAN